MVGRVRTLRGRAGFQKAVAALLSRLVVMSLKMFAGWP